MRKDIIETINLLNKVYDLGIAVDKAWNGLTEIRSADGRESYIIGTEKECASYLAGLEDAARIMADRHGLIYGRF